MFSLYERTTELNDLPKIERCRGSVALAQTGLKNPLLAVDLRLTTTAGDRG